MEPELLDVLVQEYSGPRSRPQLPHGVGKLVFRNGHQYEGEIHQGMMQGAGHFQFVDGLSWQGEMCGNAIQGRGTFQWALSRYHGEMSNGRRNGDGLMEVMDTGAWYQGQWQCGKRHGAGVMCFDPSGEVYYKGAWAEDMKQGQGVLRYRSGNWYEGEWAADVKCGQGSFHWLDGRQRYRGCWARNLPNGIGEHLWLEAVQPRPASINHALYLTRNRYRGMFLDGRREGEGVMYYATGAMYEGQWKGDLKHGEGLYVFEDGSCWRGQWESDQPIAADGGRGFAPAGFIRVNIPDLLVEEDCEEGALQGVTNVIMSSNTELRLLYDKYSALPLSSSMLPAAPAGIVYRPRRQPKLAKPSAPELPQQPCSGGSNQQQAADEVVAADQVRAKQAAEDELAAEDVTSPAGGAGEGPEDGRAKAGVDPAAESAEEPPLAAVPEEASGAESSPADAELEAEAEAAPAAAQAEAAEAEAELPEVQAAGGDADAGAEAGEDADEPLEEYEECYMMQRWQLWELLRHAGIPTKALPLAEIDQHIQAAREPLPEQAERRALLAEQGGDAAATVPDDTAPLHSPWTRVSFRQMCEVLVRVAHLRHQALPQLQRRVNVLIRQQVLPLAKPPPGTDAASLPGSMPEEAQPTMRALVPALLAVFLHVGGGSAAAASAAAGEPDYDSVVAAQVVSLRQCLRLLHKLQLLDGKSGSKLDHVTASNALLAACCSLAAAAVGALAEADSASGHALGEEQASGEAAEKLDITAAPAASDSTSGGGDARSGAASRVSLQLPHSPVPAAVAVDRFSMDVPLLFPEFVNAFFSIACLASPFASLPLSEKLFDFFVRKNNFFSRVDSTFGTRFAELVPQSLSEQSLNMSSTPTSVNFMSSKTAGGRRTRGASSKQPTAAH